MKYGQLSRYFTELTKDRIDRVVADSGVSRTTVYAIRNGKRGRPENYEKLALAIGTNRVQQREIYQRLMALSGYLDLLEDEEDSSIDERFDDLVLAELRRRFPDEVEYAVKKVAAQQRGDLEAPKRDSLPAESS